MSNASGIESVAIVGAGLMGSGIAESAAVAGVPVILHTDIDAIAAADLVVEAVPE